MTTATATETTTTGSPAETWAFGIEIECYMPVDQAFDAGRYHHGLQIRPIDNWVANGWTCERDSSVTSQYPGYVGVEIVSPKLRGEDGLVEVVCMIDWLAEIGAKVDYKCGQHVSVDAQGMSMADFTNVVAAFKKLERGMFLVNGEKAGERYRNSYCTPYGSGQTAPGARYHSLNTTVYASGTQARSRLEFRLWAGTLDAAKTVSYILASVSLVAGVVSGDLPTTVPADALGQLRQITKQYILKHRVLPADKMQDLTDICRDLVTTGKTGQASLSAATGRA